jgi:hypothetical protein
MQLLVMLSSKVLLCRYVSAIERNPDDPDAYYNWALVLQVHFHSVDITPLTLNCGSQSIILFLVYKYACEMYTTKVIIILS